MLIWFVTMDLDRVRFELVGQEQFKTGQVFLVEKSENMSLGSNAREYLFRFRIRFRFKISFLRLRPVGFVSVITAGDPPTPR